MSNLACEAQKLFLEIFSQGLLTGSWVGPRGPNSQDEFEQTWRDSRGQGNLECCSSWGNKELNMT